jgi:hypothetical protein
MAQRHPPSVNRMKNRTNRRSIIAHLSLFSASLKALRASRLILSAIIIIIVAVAIWPDLLADWTT